MFKKIAIIIVLTTTSNQALGYTANQVAFEFRPNGLYRVYLYYTVPALKEFREAVVEFTNRKKAEAYYFNILRGADFYLDTEDAPTEFINAPLEPKPW